MTMNIPPRPNYTNLTPLATNSSNSNSFLKSSNSNVNPFHNMNIAPSATSAGNPMFGGGAQSKNPLAIGSSNGSFLGSKTNWNSTTPSNSPFGRSPSLSFTATQGSTNPLANNNSPMGSFTPNNSFFPGSQNNQIAPSSIFPNHPGQKHSSTTPQSNTVLNNTQKNTNSSKGKKYRLPTQSRSQLNPEKKTMCISSLEEYVKEQMCKEEVRILDKMQEMRMYGNGQVATGGLYGTQQQGGFYGQNNSFMGASNFMGGNNNTVGIFGMNNQTNQGGIFSAQGQQQGNSVFMTNNNTTGSAILPNNMTQNSVFPTTNTTSSFFPNQQANQPFQSTQTSPLMNLTPQQQQDYVNYLNNMTQNPLMREQFQQSYTRLANQHQFPLLGPFSNPSPHDHSILNCLAHHQDPILPQKGNQHYCLTQKEYQTLLRLSNKYQATFRSSEETLPPRQESSFRGSVFDDGALFPGEQLGFDDFYHEQMKAYLSRLIGDEAAVRRLMRTDPQAVNKLMAEKDNIECYLTSRGHPRPHPSPLPPRFSHDSHSLTESPEMPASGDWLSMGAYSSHKESEYEVQVWKRGEAKPFKVQYSGFDIF